MGKIDWPAMRRRYEVLLPWVSHRVDLTLLLGELAGELGSGHSYVGGGDLPKLEKLPVGVLGAELRLDAKAGAWRLERIYPGESWTEKRRSPLNDPGVRVEEGEYLLAIDGKDLTPADEPYRLLAGKADRVVTLLVSKLPNRAGARDVEVRTRGDEDALRYQDWVERNRVKVEKATKGRVGYLHIPDMGGGGLQEFIRQYYPQIRKEALIVDVRANGGGFVSEMILERLRRVVIGMGSSRDSRPSTYPAASFAGPMVALMNAYSASDGDIFPYFFREHGLGPLVHLEDLPLQRRAAVLSVVTAAVLVHLLSFFLQAAILVLAHRNATPRTGSAYQKAMISSMQMCGITSPGGGPSARSACAASSPTPNRPR
jgi:tricorn protease